MMTEIDALIEKTEDIYDHYFVLKAYESVDMDDDTTLADMCEEAGIDYEKL